ncbi:MAG: DegT/DnrJ/EryC1/StrS family aminotransferase [Clostridia bacterium]|jgi:dTDP-4-amino-4,6-dideoxygalactose transaminase
MNVKMNIPFSPPDIGEKEIEQVIDTLKSGWITTGPKTKQFEREIANLCHTEKAVCLNSATAALELTLKILGIGEDDEVITSAYTYTASASPVAHLGAKLVLVDTQKDSVEMDYEQLANAITEKTKVIIPVDIAGIIVDYDKIFKIVEEKKNLFKPNNEIQKLYNRIIVVADSAHGIGAQKDGKMSGEIADFTTFSFHAVKNLTTAEGGAATWKNKEGLDNEAIYKQYQLLSLHGQTKDAMHKNGLGAWEYDIVDTYYKCNMTDIMAGIGLAQMERYEGLIERRHEIISKYNEAFKDLPVMVLNHRNENHRSSGHLYFIRIKGIDEEKRNEIIVKMAERGIACNVHYKPLPMLTAYKKLGFDIKEYPNAFDFYKNEITLPLYSKLTDEQVDYIIDNFKEIVEEYTK